jgi:hypothetical protein
MSNIHIRRSFVRLKVLLSILDNEEVSEIWFNTTEKSLKSDHDQKTPARMQVQAGHIQEDKRRCDIVHKFPSALNLSTFAIC